PLQHERPRDTTVDDRLVIRQLDVRPDAPREQALVLVDEVWLDVHEVEPARSEARPVLPTLVLFVERYRAEVDDLHRALLLETSLDQPALIGTNDPLGDGLLDLPQPHLDLISVRRGAELPEEVLKDVDGDVEPDLELLDQVLPDHATGEDVKELPVEVVDRHL